MRNDTSTAELLLISRSASPGVFSGCKERPSRRTGRHREALDRQAGSAFRELAYVTNEILRI